MKFEWERVGYYDDGGVYWVECSPLGKYMIERWDRYSTYSVYYINTLLGIYNHLRQAKQAALVHWAKGGKT